MGKTPVVRIKDRATNRIAARHILDVSLRLCIYEEQQAKWGRYCAVVVYLTQWYNGCRVA